MPTSSKSIFIIASTSYQSTSTMLISFKLLITFRTSSDCQSTFIVTITTTVKVNMSPTSYATMVQQSEVNSDSIIDVLICSSMIYCTSNHSCNITAIVVPTALLIIALIVIVGVNIVVKMVVFKRRKHEDLIATSISNHIHNMCDRK